MPHAVGSHPIANGAPAIIKVPDAAAEAALQLVVNAAAPARDVSFKTGSSQVEFQDGSGAQAFGASTAARFIASLSPSAKALLGETPEEEAKIDQWLIFVHTELAALLDDKLAHLNSWLEGRTWLEAGRLTLADLVVYAAVSPAAVAFPVAQHGHFCNLLRWYDLVHHAADSAALFPPPRFAKPALQPPPPPALAPKPSSADAAVGKRPDAKAAAKPAKAAAAKTAEAAAAKPAEAAAAPGQDGKGADAAGKKEKKAKKEKAPATPAASSEAPAAKAEPTVDQLDIRVGQIVKVGRHPNADSLYVEEIDLGEGQPRQVVSGLVKFVAEDKMAGRRVVVVCNLKPAKMRDVMSYGMVLCASNDAHDQVDPIVPPEGVPLGERVKFQGYGGEPEAQLNPKRKVWEKIAPDLVTDASGTCVYKGVPFMTSKGPVTATIPNAHVA